MLGKSGVRFFNFSLEGGSRIGRADWCYDGAVRRLGNLALRVLAGVSFLLLLATVVGLVRSYFVADGFSWTTRAATVYSLKWDRGRVDLVRAVADASAFVETEDSLAFEKPAAGFEYSAAAPGQPEGWGIGGLGTPERSVEWLGVRYHAGDVLMFQAQELSFPMVYAIGAFALLPGVMFERWRRRRRGARRRRATRCVRCGYDLRATPERCPECGAVASEVN